MSKRAFCLCTNKDADQLCSITAQLISVFVSASQIVQLLLNQKFQASSLLLRLYTLVYVGRGRKPKLLVFSWEG